MAIITVVCSGMMGSAITFPAAHNGHTIRLVGSPLDTEIIEHGQKTGAHLTLSQYRKNNDTNGVDAPFIMPGAVSFHYFEEMEECIKGAEVEVAVLGNDDPIVSIPGEIAPGSEFYDYDTKYKNDTATYYIPARISDSAMEKVRKYAQKIYKILGCKGLARVDFFVDGERVVFNEINTLPGFTSISMYPKMMEASGIPYSELIDRLIKLAME